MYHSVHEPILFLLQNRVKGWLMEPTRYFSWSIFQLRSDLFLLYSLNIIDEIKITRWVKCFFSG
jgi:hypothetical protein